MASTVSLPEVIVAGVDTHRDTHHVAVIDHVGRHLADAEFPATTHGYQRLLTWVQSHGTVERVGVEGTGSYGAGLARVLTEAAVSVVEVDRPDRRTRRAKGKSDAIDAYAAATAALNGTASGVPKSRTGLVEAVRALRAARRGAIKARTQTMNQLRALIVTAPVELREQLHGSASGALVSSCARLRPTWPAASAAGSDAGCAATVLAATKSALRRLARRHQFLSHEIGESTTSYVPSSRERLLH